MAAPKATRACPPWEGLSAEGMSQVHLRFIRLWRVDKARGDPPAQSYGGTGAKAQHTWKYVSI